MGILDHLLCCTSCTPDVKEPGDTSRLKKPSVPSSPPHDQTDHPTSSNDTTLKNSQQAKALSLKPTYNVINFMLLGTAGSGKSTIFKQFDKMFQADAFKNGKAASLEAIRNFVRTTFTRLTRELPDSTEYEPSDLQGLAYDLQDTSTAKDFFDNLDDSKIESLAQLWSIIKSSPGISVYQNDSDYFFMEKLSECLQADYTPTEEDFLRCRVETQMSERRKYDSVPVGKQNWTLTLTDVRGNKDDRRSWFGSFDEVDYFLYVASLADYNLQMEEDTSKNRLNDSLETFGNVMECLKQMSNFGRKGIVVLLNKEDSFKEKIGRGDDPLEKHFNKFHPNKPNDVLESKMFIKNLFQQAAKRKGVDSKDIEIKFTSAIDKKFGEKIIHSIIKNTVAQIIKG